MAINFFLVLYVDHKNRLITHERMEHKKTQNHCALLRHVVKQSFIYDGTAVVLARYDTAQHIVPTEHDIAMMHAITEPLREMAIGCVDYVIVNRRGHYSWNHSVNIKMQDQAVLMENTAHDDSDLYEWHDDDDNEEMPLAMDDAVTASEEDLLHALLFLVTKSSAGGRDGARHAVIIQRLTCSYGVCLNTRARGTRNHPCTHQCIAQFDW